jgi:hypothetical protein
VLSELAQHKFWQGPHVLTGPRLPLTSLHNLVHLRCPRTARLLPQTLQSHHLHHPLTAGRRPLRASSAAPSRSDRQTPLEGRAYGEPLSRRRRPFNRLGAHHVTTKFLQKPRFAEIYAACPWRSYAVIGPLIPGDVRPGDERLNDEVEAYPSSAADTTGIMRPVHGGYIHNLQVTGDVTVKSNPATSSPSGSTPRHPSGQPCWEHVLCLKIRK